MAAKKAKRLMLDCEICGEPVYLSKQRYVELVRASRRPRCRRNGCERLCASQNAGAARMPQLHTALDVPLRVVYWPATKRGNRNGALAKLRVTEDQRWRWESRGAADE